MIPSVVLKESFSTKQNSCFVVTPRPRRPKALDPQRLTSPIGIWVYLGETTCQAASLMSAYAPSLSPAR